MTIPAVRQELDLNEEINQREAEQDFASLTATAAVAREKVLQAYSHTTWAVIGTVVGVFGFVGFLSQMMSNGLTFLLPALGIASATWLLTDRARRQGALSRAESLEKLARSARRHLDELPSHIFTSPHVPVRGHSLLNHISGSAISRARFGGGWRHLHRAGGQRWTGHGRIGAPQRIDLHLTPPPS
jgi:hypothetical protein